MLDEQRYVAYLVRLWAVHHNGDLVWRASAADTRTGERRNFADVAGLCAFLQAAAADAPAPSGQLDTWDDWQQSDITQSVIEKD